MNKLISTVRHKALQSKKRTLEFDEGEIDESGGYFGGEGRADCVFEE